MKKLYTILSIALLTTGANAQSFFESFDNFATMVPAGWDTVQRSNNRDASSTSWFDGNPAAFAAFEGTSYIAANFQSTSTTATGTISNWLIAPVRMLNNGDKFIFNTRTATATTYPDRMQIRVSQMGVSANVGANELSVGDFSMLALDIDPLYVPLPGAGSYPDVWTRYEVTLAGLPAFPGVSGRIAFRYFVENAGWTGVNSDYIGIDSVYYKDILSGVEETNISSTISLYPNPASNNVNLNFGTGNTMERTVTITDVIGKVVFEQVYSDNSVTINVAELSAGTYTLTTKSEVGTGRKKLVIE